MSGLPPHPVQPVYLDEHGVARYRPNAIVRYLIDQDPMLMNHLARMGFSAEDRAQFAQLIGYSVSGAADLSYFPAEISDAAQAQAEALLKGDR